MAKKKENIESVNEEIQNPESLEESIEIVEEKKEEVKELSKQAKYWEAYLKEIKVTPSAFIKRFPNTKYKTFIEELL
jgi:hypothetical protein